MGLREGYKMTEVGMIPEDWDCKKMNTICEVRDGTHESPRYFSNGVLFITSKNIIRGKIDFSNVSYISSDDAISINKRSKVDKGDILMSMIGTVGNSVLIDCKPNFCIKNVALFKPRKIEGAFLIQLLFSQYYQNYIQNKLDGGIQKFISLKILRSLDVPYPPENNEQKAIATALNNIDELITNLEKLIEKKKRIKQGALQELMKPKEGWEEKRLGEVAVIKDGTHQTPKYFRTGVPFYSVENVTMNDFKNTKFISEHEHFIISRDKKIKKGDILMTRIGSIGVCKYIDWEIDASFYVSLALLK